MAAATIDLGETQEITLATTLQEIRFGSGVGAIVVTCASDIYLSIDDTGSDGGAISGTQRCRVPANVAFPIEKSGKATFVAATSGTPVAGFYGVR